MKRTVALAFLAAVACDKKADQPAPAPPPALTPGPAPAPKPVGTVAPPPTACAELRVTLSKDKLTHARGDTVELPLAGGVLDPTALTAAFGARAQECVGPLLLAATDDVAYQDLVTVMDKALGAGFTDVALDDPGPDDPAAPRPPPALSADRANLRQSPIVTISPRGVAVNGTAVTVDREAIAAALEQAKAGGAPLGNVVIQADRDTRAATINAVIRAAHETGYDNVLFAIQKAP